MEDDSVVDWVGAAVPSDEGAVLVVEVDVDDDGGGGGAVLVFVERRRRRPQSLLPSWAEPKPDEVPVGLIPLPEAPPTGLTPLTGVLPGWLPLVMGLLDPEGVEEPPRPLVWERAAELICILLRF